MALLPSPAAAQQTGHLTGSVKDIAGKGIKGAAIVARNPLATPAEFAVTTDSRGGWGMVGLQAGVWEVTANAPGYESAMVPVRVSVLRSNPAVNLVLVGSPVRGALEGIDTKELQQRLSAAEGLMAAKQWDEAVEAYRAILKDAPALNVINLAIGRALRSKKDYTGAAAAYAAILAGDATHQKALLELGRCQQESGDPAAAVATLEKLLSIDSKTPEAGEARALIGQLKK
jgi:TolA-binding protein